MDGEWISAARAYELVSTVTPIGAGNAICARASDGMISTWAKRLVWGKEVKDDQLVPNEFWSRSNVGLRQNWQSGDFDTWIDQVHCRAYGVEFLRSDIEMMLPERERRTTSSERAKNGNYAPAGSCREDLAKAVGCAITEAERLILKACRIGLVEARCQNIAWRVRDRYGTTDFEEQRVSIPEWFWERCTSGPDTLLNWSNGRFAGSGLVDGEEYKAVISGVEFLVADIVGIEGTDEARDQAHRSRPSEPNPTVADVAAGRRLSDKWRPWTAELVSYIHEAGIPEGVGSQGQEELINAVANRLVERGEEPLSRSTVQPTVQAVLDRLRSAEK
jgi:hypothetical protein